MGQYGFAGSWSAARDFNVIQGLAKIFDDVVPVLQTDRQPDAARFDALCPLQFRGQGCVGHGKWVFDQSLDLTEANR